MMNTNPRLSPRPRATLFLLLLSLSGAGCLRSLNVDKLTCSKPESCPKGYSCLITGGQGKCVPDARMDAAISDGSRGETGDGPRLISQDGNRDEGARGGAGGTLAASGGTGGTNTAAGGGSETDNTNSGVGGQGGDTSSATDTGSGGAGGSEIDAPVVGPGGSGGTSSAGGVGGSSAGGSGGASTSRDAAAPDTTTTLPVGATCKNDDQCTQGFCVDGVCCNSRCAGKCQACAEEGSVGTCKTVSSGQPRGTRTACDGTGKCQGSCDGSSATACKMPDSNQVCQNESCTGGQHTPAFHCNGSGTCVSQSASPCSTGQCASDGSGTCAGSCSATSCPNGQYCSQTGTCAAKKGNGTGNTCLSGGECTSGKCSPDGVCCQTDCPGQCQTCNNATGTCTRVASGQPVGSRPACTNASDTVCGGRCDGSSDGCIFPSNATSCGAAATCNSDYTSRTASACNSQGSCQMATTSCSATGLTCINGNCAAKVATGGSCQVNGQCDTGHCCSGFCRDFNNDSAHCGSCTNVCGNGQTCNGSGTCACPAGTAACGGGACVDILSSNEHCGPSCTNCNDTQGFKCMSGTCGCAGRASTCGCLSWNFNDGALPAWPENPSTGGNYCTGQNNWAGVPPSPSWDGTPGFKMGAQCEPGSVLGTTINLCASGVAFQGLTFSAKVRFTLPFSGSVRIWTNGTMPDVATNINGTSTIPADTWTTVTAVISDSGVRSNQFGINFVNSFDASWSGDVWLDDITIN